MPKFHPRAWDDGVMPLEEFDPDRRAAIMAAVLDPEPPPRWLDLCLGRIESRAWYEWHWARGKRLFGGPPSRPKIPAELRLAVYERDGHRCLHCGTPDRLTLDHIHPFSRGGKDTFDNLQTLCRSCNSRKGARV